MKPSGALAERLLSRNPKIRPDDITVHYSAERVQLNLQIIEPTDAEDRPLFLIEGDQNALLFLADLLLAQASDPLDCGFQILPPAKKLMSKKSKYGLYIHVLPCPETEPSSGKT